MKNVIISTFLSVVLVIGGVLYTQKGIEELRGLIERFGANSTISNLTSYTSPENDDLLVIVDTDTATTKKMTWANATSGIKSDFDTIYSPIAGSASITTVGTVTAGTWNASTLTVPYGGTASTSLSANQLFVGNGVSAVQSIGWGSSGQFLTSGGPGVLPYFTTAAIDQTASYNWTGSYFGIKNLVASATAANPAVFNGVSMVFPSTQGASSTYHCNDGTGVYYNCFPQSSIFYRSTGSSTVSQTATTTALTVPIPANTLGANGTLRITAYVCKTGAGGSSHRFEIAMGDGSASTTLVQAGGTNIGNNGNNIQTTIMNYGTGVQRTFSRTEFANSIDTVTLAADRVYRANASVDTTAKSYLAFRAGESVVGEETGYCGILIELLKP